MNFSSLSQALGIITQLSTRYLMSMRHPCHPFGEPLYTIEWRVMGTAANFKSLTIHDIVEAVFAEDLLILLCSSHSQ
jgi:hypothetical protein